MTEPVIQLRGVSKAYRKGGQILQGRLVRLRLGRQFIEPTGNFFQCLVYLRLGAVHAHALADQLADLLGGGLALGLQVLAVDIGLLALGIQGLELRHVEVETAPGQRPGHGFGILADLFDIKHKYPIELIYKH